MNYTSAQIQELFERHLSQTTIPDEPELLYAPIVYSMSAGGKRLRPTILLMAYNLFADDLREAMPAAVAVETFHNFTLLHDDIMDNAAVRRGRESVYAKWGGNVAILSGDAMLIEAYRNLQRLNPEKLPQILDVFNTMATQVCEGQQYDMDFECRQKVSVVEYMRMIELKTSVLLAGSAQIGAILAGAGDEDCSKLYRFAVELGLAFQLQDDLLDSYGDDNLGKKIGGDILEGKKTFLMITAISRGSKEQRKILTSTYKNAKLSDAEKIARVVEVYDELDVPHQAQMQIQVRMERALGILATVGVEDERTAELRAFAEGLMGRNK